jgi:hypothetical protein
LASLWVDKSYFRLLKNANSTRMMDVRKIIIGVRVTSKRKGFLHFIFQISPIVPEGLCGVKEIEHSAGFGGNATPNP